MIRRSPLALPYADQVPDLVGLLDGAPPVEPSDPARLVEAALAHGVGPTLARAVAAGAPVIEGEERTRLARRTALRRARSQALVGLLGELGALLSEACQAPPLCVKGPAVAFRLYDDPDERPFADLDLLVPRPRLEAARGALSAQGWIEDVEFSRDFAVTHGHELHLRRRHGGIWLSCELHWRIGDDPACEALDYRLLTRGAQPLPGFDAVLAPAPAIELLVLCVHFISDRERRLGWIRDIALAVERTDERAWSDSFELAGELGLSWTLHRALDYAARYRGTDRRRPQPAGPAPAWGPLRAVEELEMRASLHVGRLLALRGRQRLTYLRTILIPTREGLAGTTGGDDVPPWRAVLRHLRTALAGLLPRR